MNNMVRCSLKIDDMEDEMFDKYLNAELMIDRRTDDWKLLCEWKDGSTERIALKEIKDSYPLEIAEYAVANQIQEEPAFKWWVGDVP